MIVALCALALAAGPLIFTEGTEKPRKTEQLELPPSCSLCPAGRITCSWYPSFMVREVDLGENGAEVLAIVPRPPRGAAPACGRERAPGELSLTGAADAWSGYFEGARGRFAFFRGERGGARAAFTVFDTASEERILTDRPVGPVRVLASSGRVGVTYLRRAVAPCSPLSDGEECWGRIRDALGVGDPAPDCAPAYRDANDAAAKAACASRPDSGPLCVEAELRLRPAVPPFVPPSLTYEVVIPDLERPMERATGTTKVVDCRPPE